MAQERQATLKGNPITLVGPELKKGDKAPEFSLNKSLVDLLLSAISRTKLS